MIYILFYPSEQYDFLIFAAFGPHQVQILDEIICFLEHNISQK